MDPLFSSSAQLRDALRSRVRPGRRRLDGLLGGGLRIIHGLRRLLHRARSAVVEQVPHQLPPRRRPLPSTRLRRAVHVVHQRPRGAPTLHFRDILEIVYASATPRSRRPSLASRMAYRPPPGRCPRPFPSTRRSVHVARLRPVSIRRRKRPPNTFARSPPTISVDADTLMSRIPCRARIRRRESPPNTSARSARPYPHDARPVRVACPSPSMNGSPSASGRGPPTLPTGCDASFTSRVRGRRRHAHWVSPGDPLARATTHSYRGFGGHRGCPFTASRRKPPGR
jgi:hypothetical protein